MEEFFPMIQDALGMFLFLGAELSILFIIIAAAVSLLQSYIPDSKIQSILSGSGGRGYVLAVLLGAITPFCSCSTIPMLRGLLKAKAGFGPTITFLFASPLLNPIIITLFWATFGFKVTCIYTIIALCVSALGGFVIQAMNFERHVIPEQEGSGAYSCCSTSTNTSSCCEAKPSASPFTPMDTCCEAKPTASPFTPMDACCETTTPQNNSCCSDANSTQKFANTSITDKIKFSFAEAIQQFKQVFPYLLLGVSLGAVVYGFVPSDFIATYASGESLFAVPFAAIVGIPLYIRVEALIPLSAVLLEKGMGLGAIMALIIGGGGASLTELILLKSMFRMPMLIAFLTVILGMAIFAGYLFQFIM